MFSSSMSASSARISAAASLCIRAGWVLSWIVLPIQDLHIAACALHIGAAILNEEKHFRQTRGLTAVSEKF